MGPGRVTSSLLGSLNPLHHIPVVATVYGHMTETRAIPAVRILVGAALAGPVGFIAALADALIEEITGRTVGGHAVAALIGEPKTAVAARDAHESLGPLVGDAGSATDGTPATPSVGARSPPRADRVAPDTPPTREVARAYLLELALRHPLRSTQDGATNAIG